MLAGVEFTHDCRNYTVEYMQNASGSHGASGGLWDFAVGHRYKPNISIRSKVPAAISRSIESLVAKTLHISPQAGNVRNGSKAAVPVVTKTVVFLPMRTTF
jgi:hypothetical protein